jgi:hypothetical protein
LFSTVLGHERKGLIIRAHKWRKAWVAPTGSQPEASYKICRYVKVGKDDKVHSILLLTPILPWENQADDQDVEDETNGDEEDDDEGEGEGEGEEDEEEDGDEEEGDEKVVATPATDTPAGTEQAVGESTAPTPIVPASSDPAPESTPPTLPTTSTETPSTAEHQLPSNAIELTNTNPNHVADGSTATVAGGIELTQSHDQPSSTAEPAATVVGSLGQNEEKMEVDSPIIEKGEAVEEDAGLVMGEMTPPVGQKELELEKTELDTVKETESAPVGQIVEEQKSEDIKADEKTGEVVSEQPPALE